MLYRIFHACDGCLTTGEETLTLILRVHIGIATTTSIMPLNALTTELEDLLVATLLGSESYGDHAFDSPLKL